MWWGFSEALDLSSEISELQVNNNEKNKSKNIYNILLIGQHDSRHVLKTIAQKYRHKNDIILNLYSYEPLIENIARELLFITLALEPNDHVGVTEKTIFFMELYGNSLIRPATSRYLSKISKQLINMVTNLSYTEKIFPSISLKDLKYKERDQLEIIFKYWASCDNSFNILKAWDERLRKHLGARYDSRYGAFDWDYHMRYHCYGADLLKIQEYKTFREKGIGFYFEGTDPCVPNNTLASGIFLNGTKILSSGYWGDIMTGPFVTFGLNCEDEDMLKKINGQTSKSAKDITERNVMRLFHEIQHQNSFIPKPRNDEMYLSVILEDTSSKLKILEPDSTVDSKINHLTTKNSYEIYKPLDTSNCNVIFMPTNALQSYTLKNEFKNIFDLVFISQSMVLKHTRPEMFIMFKSNCKIIVETPKFLLNYRKEDLERFKVDLINLMSSCKCKLIKPYNTEKDEVVYFKLEK